MTRDDRRCLINPLTSNIFPIFTRTERERERERETHACVPYYNISLYRNTYIYIYIKCILLYIKCDYCVSPNRSTSVQKCLLGKANRRFRVDVTKNENIRLHRIRTHSRVGTSHGIVRV